MKELNQLLTLSPIDCYTKIIVINSIFQIFMQLFLKNLRKRLRKPISSNLDFLIPSLMIVSMMINYALNRLEMPLKLIVTISPTSNN